MEAIDRRQQLLDIFAKVEDSRDIILPLIDDVVFLEQRLDELRQMPFIWTNKKNPSLHRATPAAKQYKELLQQYNNCIKILSGILRKDSPEEESPLRAYLKARKEKAL